MVLMMEKDLMILGLQAKFRHSEEPCCALDSSEGK